MNKYFIEKIHKTKKLSSYLSGDETLYKKSIINYIISIVGDVELPEEYLNIICKQFNRIAGRYSVMTESETIKGMLCFIKKYPFLSTTAIEILWPKYIYDLFENYSLPDKFNIFLIENGKNDECFNKFVNYIDKKAEELQETYKKDTENLLEINSKYSQRFISYLKSLILNKHIRYENIEKALPRPELIEKDEKTLLELSEKYRIYFGVCYPISYQMVYSLAKNNSLDDFDEVPKYYINLGGDAICYEAPFKKEEYMESVDMFKKAKNNVKKKKEKKIC